MPIRDLAILIVASAFGACRRRIHLFAFAFISSIKSEGVGIFLSKFGLKCVPRNADPLEFWFYRLCWKLFKLSTRMCLQVPGTGTEIHVERR